MRITKATQHKRTKKAASHANRKTSTPLRKSRRGDASSETPSRAAPDPVTSEIDGNSSLEEQFKYQPLDSRKNEIRLLQLLPVRKFDGVECGIEFRIHHVSLDNPPVYSALSYVWGTKGHSRTVLVEGCAFPVTVNLHGALLQLQSSSTRLIWVDAICINQKDVMERSEQVVRMGDIFRLANDVNAWLGEADKDSELAFALLRDLKECLQVRSRCNDILKDPGYIEHLYGLYRLFYRDYWWRVWVIQEINSARTVMIICGWDSFLWSDLVAIQEMLSKHHLHEIDEVAHDRPELSFLRVSIETRGPRQMLLSTTHRSSERLDLTQTLLGHRFKDSSDPKDMIYSLVGLSNAHKDPLLVMDYSRSVNQVYTDVIEYVLNTTRKLDIICAMPRGSNPYGLPSWVPDWSFKGHGSSFLEDTSKHNFCASGTRDAEAWLSSDRAVLNMRGISLGRLRRVGVATEMEDLEDECHAASAFHNWQKLFGPEHGDALVIAEALCKNIIVQKYQPTDIARWMEKPDYVEWMLGAFVRATIAISPEIELDARFLASVHHHASWRSRVEDNVLGRILFKGAAEMMFNRRVFISDSNLIGLGPDSLREGDILVVILGCQLPVILREEAGYITYLGEAFVDGYMYGKAIDEVSIGENELRNFEIH